MNHFHKVKSQIDVRPLLAEIERLSSAWQINTGRQRKIAVQREAQSIPLRGLVKSKIGARKRRDVHESRFTNASRKFPVARALITAFAAERNGELGRAKLVRLKPGNRVYPHIDRGEYYRFRDRYHLIVQSELGSYLKSSDESIRMHEGELWWFDNKAVHEAMNDGDADRIHLIFDVLPEHRLSDVYNGGQAA